MCFMMVIHFDYEMIHYSNKMKNHNWNILKKPIQKFKLVFIPTFYSD